jgi:hypothetical protein
MRKILLALTAAAVAVPTAMPAPVDAAQRKVHRYHHKQTYHPHRRCPRHSGTTGALVGGGAGALVGGAVSHGLAGPLIGAAGGALLGRHVGRHTC